MRKQIGMGAAFVATAALLAACSSDPEPAETPSAEAETSETAEAPSGEGAELVVWTDAEREEALATAAEQFEADTGATVTLVQKNFEDLRNDFIAQVPTGEGPDITVGAHDWLGALIEAGVVNTLDIGEKAADFQEVALDAMTYDGQLYGLPYSTEAIALIQNADLVGDTAPTTWEEMIQMSVDAGFEDRPFILFTNGTSGDGYSAYPLQTSFGAPVFVQDESGSYTTEVGMGGEAGEAFAQFLYDNGADGTGYFTDTIDYDTSNELFSSGESPFILQGPWMPFFDGGDMNLVVSPMVTAGGEPAAPFVGVQGFYLSSQSDNALLANDFLVNYMATEDAQRTLYEADPRVPALTALAEEVSTDPVTAGFVESAALGVPMPSIPEMGNVWEIWNAAEIQLITGSADDPAATWNDMVSELEASIG
ncbi:sugar ABC transporter substrate-binding protein [Demequina activiva]|uniref:Sugar ABC transporter substrate-binding protein n=1 Tax=Demequina activiva TaxID=1582364 RepID=A0A919UKS3_9MICO|nr:extracellular solute-binding protein [Demequina activiva]GIG55285.1 sugar ABC transporter substrate-binding protein [Demequina activiva]